MTLSNETRAFYTQPAAMTALGDHAAAVDALPRDVGGLCDAIQGFLIHEHWAPAYRQRLTPARRAESQLRSTQQVLDTVFAKNAAPLTVERPLYEKTVGVCRHFAVLMVAILRRQGVPARARCGFGAYFRRGAFEDHWVAEYWDGRRWRLVDAQIDLAQRSMLHLDRNLHDVPRDKFIIAGEAWQRCRAGAANPDAFGIFDMHGLWFIAGNVVRDFAALNNVEMLPWDCWGTMTATDQPMTDDTISLLDRVAALTLDPDANFEELRALYGDSRLAVPPVVFNAVMKRDDAVLL